MKSYMIGDDDLKLLLDNPVGYAKAISIKKLVELLVEFSNAYYNEGKTVISDEIYDILRDVLKKRDPKNKYLKQTGAPVVKGEVDLPFPMPSLDKIKPEHDAIDKFKAIYGGPYVISDKLDGVSAMLHKNGNLMMYTKGETEKGQNISHLIPNIFGNISLDNINKKMAIRGELIISKANFQKIENIYANARAATIGIVNSKYVVEDNARLIDFIAYAIVNPRFLQVEQMEKLKKLEFQVVQYQVWDNLNNELLSRYLEVRRKESLYDIDGLVVIDSGSVYDLNTENPEHGFAFKMVLDDQIAETTVVDIVWNISKDGYLAPVVKVSPVKLLGVVIKKAAVYNAKYVVDNGLGIGAVVKILRSGDVIPKILEVVKPAKEVKMPAIPYVWTDSEVNIIVKDVCGAAEDAIIVKRLAYFFGKLKVKGISEGIVKLFVDAGYRSVVDILKADREKLVEIDGLGEKTIANVYEGIEEAFKKLDLATLMVASNEFGRGLGDKKLKIIVMTYPDIMNSKWTDNELRVKITNLNGFEKKTANQFVGGLRAFKKFFAELSNVVDLQHVISPHVDSTKGDKFQNQHITLTGFRDKNIEKFIIDNGGQISNTVSKKTSMIVYTSKTGSKFQKALQLGIKLVPLDEFKTYM